MAFKYRGPLAILIGLFISLFVGLEVDASSETVATKLNPQEQMLIIQENLRRCETSAVHQTWNEMSEKAKLENCEKNGGLFQQVDKLIAVLKQGRDFSEIRGADPITESLTRLNLATLDAAVDELEGQISTLDLVLAQAEFREKNGCQTNTYLVLDEERNPEEGPKFSCEKIPGAIEFWGPMGSVGSVDAIDDIQEMIEEAISRIYTAFEKVSDFFNHQYNLKYGTQLPVKDPSYRPKCWPQCQVSFQAEQRGRNRLRTVHPRFSIAENQVELIQWMTDEFKLNEIPLPLILDRTFLMSDVLTEVVDKPNESKTPELVVHGTTTARVGWRLEKRSPPSREALKSILRDRKEMLTNLQGYYLYRWMQNEKNLRDHYAALSKRAERAPRRDQLTGPIARTKEFAEQELEFLLAAFPETTARVLLASPEFSAEVCSILQNMSDRERARRLQGLLLDGLSLGLTVVPIVRGASAALSASQRPLSAVSQWILGKIRSNFSRESYQQKMQSLLESTRNLRGSAMGKKTLDWVRSKDGALMATGLGLGGTNAYLNLRHADERMKAISFGSAVEHPPIDQYLVDTYSLAQSQQEELTALTIDTLASPSRTLSLWRSVLPFLE